MAGSATAVCNPSDSTADHRAPLANRKIIIEIGIRVAKKLEIRGLHIGGIQLYDDPHRPMLPAFLGNRLTVDPRTLTPLVLVRIQVPQPAKLIISRKRFWRFGPLQRMSRIYRSRNICTPALSCPVKSVTRAIKPNADVCAQQWCPGSQQR